MTRSRLARVTAALLMLIAFAPAWAGVVGSDRGVRPEALEPCDEHWDRGRRLEARQCYSTLATSSDAATRAEAWWALGEAKRANEIFRDAVKASPENADLRVRWGYLFQQTHNDSEALNLFNEAIGVDPENVPAKLGIASVLGGRFDGKAKRIVADALETDSDQVLGHLLTGRMALEESEFEKAENALDTALEKARELGRSPLEAFALMASLDLLRGDLDSEWTRKTLEHNPTYGAVWAELAHFYVITRRYREAIGLLEKAVEVDPELWSAHADLGVNLLRENRDAEAMRHLEIAFENDPFSAKTVNTLRLIDSFKKFRLISNKDMVLLQEREQVEASLNQPEVILRLQENEAELLRPYAMELAEKSIAIFSKKYRFTPKKPIYVELYPDHDDFAVRTMGMPGVGLLGVTFGYLVAMDSPAGRPPGQFHWGTTLWHEMAHVFTLEATEHLVPRWFSEGVSMHEEWLARPNWGERISPDFIKAMVENKLLPIAVLDRGFIRPSYPNQVAVSYFQAGLICRMIEKQWGADQLVAMLEAFGRGASTPSAVEGVLEIEVAAFDEKFEEFLADLLGPLAEEDGLENWRSHLKAAFKAVRGEDWEAAIEAGEKALAIYPDFVGAGNPYQIIANARKKLGDNEAELDFLERYFRRGGRDPKTLKKLARLQDEAGRRSAAIETLDEILYVWPVDEELHALLGDWLSSEGRDREALREYRALLAMDPHDKAQAHYRLADTYHKMENRGRARRHVLMALEIAPSYKPAQKLLLEIAR